MVKPGGVGSIPGWGKKIPQAMWHCQIIIIIIITIIIIIKLFSLSYSN